MALNTSIRTVTCYLQSGVCWHRLVAGCWEYLDDFSTYTHTLRQAHIHSHGAHTYLQLQNCADISFKWIFLAYKKRYLRYFGMFDAVEPGRKLHPPFQCSNQAVHTHIQHTDSGYFHTHTHTHTSQHTGSLSISALTIGSLCWAGWDVRMNQCEDSWLDMPIHLPKKRERKRGARDSKRNELSPWSNMFGYLHYLTDPLKGFQ